MKCPNCGFEGIQPSYKFCPKCRQSFDRQENILNKERMSLREEKSYSPFDDYKQTEREKERDFVYDNVDDIRHIATWSVSQSEIARRITPQEWNLLDKMKGVYVQEGVTAVIFVDGQKVIELSSGLYYFSNLVERASDAVRGIWRFFTGKKKDESDEERSLRRNKLDVVLRQITGKSVVEVILVTEGYIPLVLGVKETTEGLDFEPYRIMTHVLDIEIGVSLQMRISNFEKFRINHLTSQNRFRISDLQLLVNSAVRNVVQRELQQYNVQSVVLPDELINSMRVSIKHTIEGIVYGFEVIRVIDITTNSQDFNRFREVEKRLYCSEKELDFLKRTNDFRNRLASEENDQLVRESRTELELRKALNAVNKDSLLHEDELEEFAQILMYQKAIRVKKFGVEQEKSINDLEGNRLINLDDFNELKEGIKRKEYERSSTTEILRLLSDNRVDKERARVNSELLIYKTELEIKEIDASMKKAEAEHLKNKQTKFNEFEIKDIEQEHKHKNEKSEALHSNDKIDIELKGMRMTDDYVDERREKDYTFTKKEREDDYAFVKRAKEDTIELDKKQRQNENDDLARKVDISASLMERMNKDMRETKKQEFDHEYEMEKLNTEALLNKYKIQSGMDADQIIASELSSLSAEAQAKYADSFASKREIDILRENIREREELYKKMMQQSMDHQKEMSEFTKFAMEKNSDIAKSSLSGQFDKERYYANSIVNVATARVNELEMRKEEYRNEAHRVQERMDKTQDTALNYTTKVTESADFKEAMKDKDLWCPFCGFSLKTRTNKCPKCNKNIE